MEELVLTRKQRLAGNLTAGAAVIAAGLVLLLAGADVIKADVKVLAAPVLLSAVGLSLLVTALIQRNVVSLWVSFAFTVPALVSFLAAFTSVGYKELYPLYIAIPAIASLFTMPMSRSLRDHGKVVLLFGVTAALFALNSSGLLGWGVVGPLLIVYVGLLIVYAALKSHKKETKEEDEDNA